MGVYVEYGPVEGVRELGGGARIPSPPGVDDLAGRDWGLATGDHNGDGFTDLAIGMSVAAEGDPLRAWLFLGGPAE